jgi:hypothetical protein
VGGRENRALMRDPIEKTDVREKQARLPARAISRHALRSDRGYVPVGMAKLSDPNRHSLIGKRLRRLG